MIDEGINMISLPSGQVQGQGQKFTTKTLGTPWTPSFTKQARKLKLTWCSLVTWWLAVIFICFTYPDARLGECLHV